MKNYDIVVIGSGAGLIFVRSALANGKKCAIVENGKFGGTCLTKGCIPSKMLVYPADVLRDYKKAERVGIRFAEPAIDWAKILDRMWQQIGYSEQIEKRLKKTDNLKVYNGTAEFTGKRSLKIRYDDSSHFEQITADIIVIANGARSFIPPISNIEQTGYVTSETFFGEKFPKKPWESLIIVGGGAIGAEFAHIFSAFGTKVSIVEMRPNIIATEEKEISVFVENSFKNNGIDVFTNTKIIDSNKSGGSKSLKIENMLTGETRVIEAEQILIAAGVMSNSDTLNLFNTDIKTDDKGYIVTDEYLETTQKGVYAIGDINGKYQFRHTANYEAEILMHNLFSGSGKKRACYDSVPWAIFCSPQVAHVGRTEEQLKAQKKKYWVGKNYYSKVAGGIAMGISDDSYDNGFVKILAGEDRAILGVHIVGAYASILIQPFVYLMNCGFKCEKRQFKKNKETVCPQLGSFAAIENSMVIHPSLNELTAWVIEHIDWQHGFE